MAEDLFVADYPLISCKSCYTRYHLIFYALKTREQVTADFFIQFQFFLPLSIIIVFILLFTPLEFFASVLADGLSLEFEGQQVSSSLQDSSQYSGHSQ